jgi:hypothetical protein
MWVYAQDSLLRRLRLPEPLAYWVDYWLFLHADETHSIWRVRPLGLRLVATTALVDAHNTNAQLLRQIADEAIAAARIAPFLPGIPVPPPIAPVQGSRWHPEWMGWFESLLRPDVSSILLHDFVVALAQALDTGDYALASFITRRLAAELAEHEWSDRALFRIVKTNFCDANTIEAFSRESFATLLGDAFSEPPVTKYRAAIELAPTLVWPRFERILEKPRRLRVEAVDGGKTILRGLTLEVTASHYDEAAAIALDELRDVLERLRLFHNVRTHAIGAIEVTRVDDSRIFTVDLPQPFWTAGPGRRRDVPHVPYYQLVRSHRLTPAEKIRWRAAQWHVSQSLAIWAEDTHAAASHVWQALESYSESDQRGINKVLPLASEYLVAALPTLAEYLAAGIAGQSVAIRGIGQICNWACWSRKKQPIHEWMRSVLDHRASIGYSRRSIPLPPALIFDLNAGLLRVVDRKLADPTSELWMESRLTSDLRLLYGIRNAVVHRGERILSRRMAAYLGRTGLEVLFAVMEARMAKTLPRRPNSPA